MGEQLRPALDVINYPCLKHNRGSANFWEWKRPLVLCMSKFCSSWWYAILSGICHHSLIARFMGPTWGPSGADRTHLGPRLVPWTLLSSAISAVKTKQILQKKTWQNYLQNHCLLRYLNEIFGKQFSSDSSDWWLIYLSVYISLYELHSVWCHWTLLMIGQHLFR